MPRDLYAEPLKNNTLDLYAVRFICHFVFLLTVDKSNTKRNMLVTPKRLRSIYMPLDLYADFENFRLRSVYMPAYNSRDACNPYRSDISR